MMSPDACGSASAAAPGDLEGELAKDAAVTARLVGAGRRAQQRDRLAAVEVAGERAEVEATGVDGHLRDETVPVLGKVDRGGAATASLRSQNLRSCAAGLVAIAVEEA